VSRLWDPHPAGNLVAAEANNTYARDVSADHDELVHLIDGLPKAERDTLTALLRSGQSGVTSAYASTSSIMLEDKDTPAEWRVNSMPEHGRRRGGPAWPMGPATFGAAVLVGWAAGIVGGPMVAAVGAVAGLFVGQVIDRATRPSDT